MKYKLTLELDGSEFFDAVQKIGQETAGARLLETFLQASTGSFALRERISRHCANWPEGFAFTRNMQPKTTKL
jgi:hypothetical protein